MENYSYSSYPDSGDSSPRSREIDDTQSWDEPPSSNYKVKFMCSYGGKIQPRPHDNQLAYIGGDTKILSLDRTVKYSAVVAKLSSLCGGPDSDLCFKYQLPGEDLDALISVTNDEDLEHMMMEYDRLCRASPKPARLRIFLFSASPRSFGSGEAIKSEGQWFVDALNSAAIGGHNLDVSNSPSPPPPPAGAAVVSAGNPDFLFGLEKGFPSGVPMTKLAADAAAPQQQQQAPPAVEVVVGVGVGAAGKEFSPGSDDRQLTGEQVMNNQQISDFQRFQISNQEQVAVSNSRGFPGEFYVQKVPEKLTTGGPSPVPVHMPIPMSGTYVQERYLSLSPHPVAASPGGGNEQQVYVMPGMYQNQGIRPVTGQMGGGYYGVQRVVHDVYREQPAYNGNGSIQQQQGMGVVQQQKVGGMAEQQGQQGGGYVQVGYDSAGRQVYFTSAYQPVSVAAMEARQGGAAGGGAANQEVKVVAVAGAGGGAGNVKVAQAQAQAQAQQAQAQAT